MYYEFQYGEDSLIINLSGTAGVNERLLTKKYLLPHLRRSYHNVIVDLTNLNEPGEVYILGVLNTIKKEFQMLGCIVKLCSLKPKLHLKGEGKGSHNYLIRAAYRNVLIDSGLDQNFLYAFMSLKRRLFFRVTRSLPAGLFLILPNREVWGIILIPSAG